MVIITFGPFAGLSGVVISSAPDRTTVRIVLKGRSIPVEVDTNMIRVPVRDRLKRVGEFPPPSRLG